MTVPLASSCIPWRLCQFEDNGKWQYPPVNEWVWGLIEDDSVGEHPWVWEIRLEETGHLPKEGPKYHIRLKDAGEHDMEEILQQHYTLVAWRPLEQMGNTTWG